MPGVVREDGEVGGDECGRRRERKEELVLGVVLSRRRWRREGEEAEELEGGGAADGEGFDDELAAEAEAFDVGGGLEVGGVWIVLVFVVVFVLVFLLLFVGGGVHSLLLVVIWCVLGG